MIKFITIAGEQFNGIDQLLDLNAPLNDPRLATMTDIILFRRNNNISKIIFIIDTTPFMTLYDTMMQVKKLDVELVIITVIFIPKPIPPLSPSIGINITKTTIYNDLCDQRKKPVSFLEWYDDSEVINFLNKIPDYSHWKNKTDIYCFVYNYYAFDNLEDCITYAIWCSYIHNKNIEYTNPIWLNVYIQPGVSKNILAGSLILKQEIYSFLITIPEWKEYFDLWEEFWMKPPHKENISKLNTNQNIHVYDY